MGGTQVTDPWTFRWHPILMPVGLVVLHGFDPLSRWDGARIGLLTFTDGFRDHCFVPDLELFDLDSELTSWPSPYPAWLLGSKGAAAFPRLVPGLS
jgi:hypothetical protein